MQDLPKTIIGLSHKYEMNARNLYYLSTEKKYSKSKIKKAIFEKKYGPGNPKTNYYNYYLPRLLNKNNDFTQLKKSFFEDYKLSSTLTYGAIEEIWEKIMQMYLKLI